MAGTAVLERLTARFGLTVATGAKRNALELQPSGALRLWIAAPAVDGKANAALVRYLAGVLGVRQRQVVIVQGTHARHKRIVVEGIDQAEAIARLSG
ncbi:MAG: DUF167 domain-containing protein [Dehalococcoidia bacterium]